jgi:hypothetical protein
LALMGQSPRVPGHTVGVPPGSDDGRITGDVEVRDDATGVPATVTVVAVRPAGEAPRCEVGRASFTLADLFGIQRERLLAALGREAGTGALGGLAAVDPLLRPLLDDETALPAELAALVGWKAALAIAGALDDGHRPVTRLIEEATTLRRRGGVFPSGWLGPRILRALTVRIDGLPDAAAEALALLDLAKAADVRLDLGPAQIQALRWWQVARPEALAGAPLAILRERLAIAPEQAVEG